MRFPYLGLLSGTLALVACAGPAGDDGMSRADALSSACAEAHVASLVVTKFDADAIDVQACEAGAAMPADVAAALADIKDINEKAAKLFGVAPAQLFGSGIRIRIQTSDGGFNGSFETHDDDDLPVVHIETVSSPKHLLNRGVYAHELGHWLLWVPGARMPMALRSLGQSHFWGEGIADTIALALEGTVTSSEPGVPACLESRSNADLANRSYRGPNGFFLNRFQRAQAVACCEAHESSPEFAKGAAMCDAQLELEQGSPFDSTIPFDTAPFPVEEAASKLRAYSRYQLGTPVSSFLLDAQKAIDPGIIARYLEAAKKVALIDYACTLGGSAENAVRVSTASVRAQLALLRSGLDETKQARFDTLASAHGLEALDVLEPAELDLRAAGLAANRLLIEGAPGEGARLPVGHACSLELQFAALSSSEVETPPACKLACTRVP